jgi:plastocyanin domain-containing protein
VLLVSSHCSNMQNDAKIALIFCGVILGLLVLSFVVQNNNSVENVVDMHSAVRIQNGVQIIDVTAKGGYSPNIIEATAGVPTELHVTTQGTFDCSASLVIPAFDYKKVLEPTGTEVITIAENKAQGTVRGTCGMGMYDFQIIFI